MPVNSKRKGSRGEREAAEYLRTLGFKDAIRTQQYCGTNGKSDVECPESLPSLHIEVKVTTSGAGGSSVDIGSKGWYAACEQAMADCNGDDYWVVLWRPTGVRTWRLTFYGASPGLLTVCGDNDIRDVLNWLNDNAVGADVVTPAGDP